MPIRTALPSLFGLTVLIVDDNPVVLHATRAGAFHLGLAVQCADDGHGALDALSAHPVDAVLMDLHMPGLDGIATTRAIRALGTRWADVPVLGISANTDDANRARCREAGMSGLIGKPVLPATLAAALASLCCTPAAGAPRRRPWFDDGAGADRDARAVRDPRAAGVTAQRNGARSAPGFRLEEALDEQLALHGAAHPLTRALMRAAGRSPADVDRPLSLPVR